VLILQLIYKSHARLLSRLMDLIIAVTSGKWKMGISLAVRVEGAIDACIKCIMPLPASYKELKVMYSLLLLLLRLFVTRKIPSRRPQMRYPAVRKCCCLYTMYHIKNNVFSCVLKVYSHYRVLQ